MQELSFCPTCERGGESEGAYGSGVCSTLRAWKTESFPSSCAVLGVRKGWAVHPEEVGTCPAPGVGCERLPTSSVRVQGWKELGLVPGGPSYKHTWCPGHVLLLGLSELRGCVTLWAQPASFGWGTGQGQGRGHHSQPQLWLQS